MPATKLPMLRTSERREFRRCPQRWQWGTVEGWHPKYENYGNLWFGTGVHLALAEWYQPGKKRGVHPVKTWLNFCKDEYNWARAGEYGTPEEEMVKTRDLGEAMLTNYIDTYDRDKSWRVIQPERTGRVRIPHPTVKGKFLVEYVFTFDLIYFDEDEGIYKLGEHKTAAQIITTHLSLDDQAGSYLPMATTLLRSEGLLKPTERVEVITYNFLRKGLKKPDDRPTNKQGLYLNADGTVSKRQNVQAPLLVRHSVERAAAERHSQVSRIQAEAIHMQKMRSGELPIYKNPTRDCSWDCAFFQICELHEGAGDWEDLRDATMKKRDAYEPYRKSA